MPKLSLHASQLSLSTGSLARVAGGNPDLLIERLGQVEPPGVEVLLFGRWSDDIDGSADKARAADLRVWTVHGEKRIGGKFGRPDRAEQAEGQRLFVDAVRFCERVGCPYLSTHLWDLPDSDADLARNLAALAEVHDEARRRGVTVLIEVIPTRHHEPLENMARVVDALGDEALFTIDFEFLSWNRPIEEQLPAIVDAFGERIVNLHIRDYDGKPFSDEGKRRYVRPGAGRIAFERVFDLLHQKARPRIYTLEGSYDAAGDWAGQVADDLARVAGWMAGAHQAGKAEQGA
ncbi:MAG TPA: TIM barrel protein [Limnochordia bacterium]|nr:TIM barrel protein [Limnochordia bacterium]